MKAIALVAPRTLEMVEQPDPKLTGPDDVLLQIEAVGLCGSDIHYYTRGRIGCQVIEYPFVLGHEFSAMVLETGSGVQGLAPGDRVAVDPAMSCGRCDQCLADRRHTCRALRFLGNPNQREGCLSERMIMPADCCHRVPDGLDDDLAALAEPLSIGLYAVRLSGARPGDRVGILGAGPIGRSVLMAARDAGIKDCRVTEPIPERRSAAIRAGARWTGAPLSGADADAADAMEDDSLDVVFECAGAQEALDDGLALLKPGGRLMIVGIPSTDRVSFDVDQMRHKEICLQNVRRQNGCVPATLDLLARAPDEARLMRTHVYAFDRFREAFELVAAYRDGVVKAMVHVGSCC